MTPKLLLLLFIFHAPFSSACIPSANTWCASSNPSFTTAFEAYGRGPQTLKKTLYLYGTCSTTYAYARVQATPTDYSSSTSSEYLQVYLDDESSSTKTTRCRYMGAMSTTQTSFPPRVNCLSGFSMASYIPSSSSTSRTFVVRMYIPSSVNAGIGSSLSPYYLNATLELYCSNSVSSLTVAGGAVISTVNTSSNVAAAVVAAVWLCILLGVCLPCCLCFAVVGCMWMMGACCFAAAANSGSNRNAVTAAPLITTQETTVVTTQMATQETTPYAPPQVTQQPQGAQPMYNPQAGYVANPGVYPQQQYGQPQYGQPPQYGGQVTPAQQAGYQPYAQGAPPQYQPQYAPNAGQPPAGYPAQP